jgi:hypothetical protein
VAKRRIGGNLNAQTRGTSNFKEVLEAAGVRPVDAADTTEKKNYSQRLSENFAVLMANRLRAEHARFQGILPNPDGTGQESRSVGGSNKKLKKTDVRYSTRDSGLELLVSIKTLNFKNSKKDRESGEVTVGRYTKNMVRNDHELRAEAMEHHERFPYAVLIGVFLIPSDSCDDGIADISSFAHAILTFRQRTGRNLPTDPKELFERFFIGLYEHSGDLAGEIIFYDVTSDHPPRRGLPRLEAQLSLDALVGQVIKTYGVRNRTYIEWAGDEDIAIPALEDPPDETDDADSDGLEDEPQ